MYFDIYCRFDVLMSLETEKPINCVHPRLPSSPRGASFGPTLSTPEACIARASSSRMVKKRRESPSSDRRCQRAFIYHVWSLPHGRSSYGSTASIFSAKSGRKFLRRRFGLSDHCHRMGIPTRLSEAFSLNARVLICSECAYSKTGSRTFLTW
jgi:hypothetical protein